ncbi:MAG: class I tRNA ligase family protein, partial [Dehalococcoidia bacterium]
RLYEPDLWAAERPFYNLMMFPYPSAEGLHVGNVYAFVGADVYGRFMAMQGWDAFEPMGFDAFGIHSENFAIQRGVHPKVLTAQNVERFRVQLRRTGNRFDWSHEVLTTDPAYYRWTQWIFVQLFKAGLAVRKRAAVNWCPKDKTVLADEQVIDGRCERCDTPVVQRELEQWFFRITAYAEQLLDNLDRLDWSETVKTIQRNWIGRSEGLEFELGIGTPPPGPLPPLRAERGSPIGHTLEPTASLTPLSSEAGEGPGEGIALTVFTTRPDTVFGMTYVVLAPEHPLVDRIVTEERRAAVEAYREATRHRSELERLAAGAREKTGEFTGAYAVNPANGERVPIWAADYVLMSYGSGAIMAVPAHDERDFAFATAFGLPVRTVVMPAAGQVQGAAAGHPDEAYTGDGVLVDSGAFTGMPSAEAARRIIEWFEKRGVGRRSVQYRLRDWLISRQRYWGPPIPIVYCEACGTLPVPEEQLPVLLPELEDWLPTGTGASPLAQIPEFVNTICPTC